MRTWLKRLVWLLVLIAACGRTPVDIGDNESGEGQDPSPPIISITHPPEGTRIAGDTVTLIGTASEAAELLLELNGELIETAFTRYQTRFSVTVTGLREGENTIAISARSQARAEHRIIRDSTAGPCTLSHGDNLERAIALALDQQVMSALCEGKQYYTFLLDGAQVVRLETFARRELFALTNTVLTLYDARGQEVARNDDLSRTVRDSRLSILLPAGQFFLSVEDAEQRTGDDYRYRLDLETTLPEVLPTFEVALGTFIGQERDGEVHQAVLMQLSARNAADDALPYDVLLYATPPDSEPLPLWYRRELLGVSGFVLLGETGTMEALTEQLGTAIYIASDTYQAGSWRFTFPGGLVLERVLDFTTALELPSNVRVTSEPGGTEVRVLFDAVEGAVEYTAQAETTIFGSHRSGVAIGTESPIVIETEGREPLQRGEPLTVTLIAADFTGFAARALPVPDAPINLTQVIVRREVGTITNFIQGTLSQKLPQPGTAREVHVLGEPPTATAISEAPPLQRVMALLEPANGMVLPVNGEMNAQQLAQLKATAESLAQAYGLSEPVVQAPRLGFVTFNTPQGNPTFIAAQLQRDPRVRIAEPSYWYLPQAIPNDPLYGLLWGLQGIEAEAAWTHNTGSRDVVVAVIDSGLGGPLGSTSTTGGHEDLSLNLIPGYDFVSDLDVSGIVDATLIERHPELARLDADHIPGRDPYPVEPFVLGASFSTLSDVGSHGSHVAGTIGAVGNNATGVVGVNWQVSLQMLRAVGTIGGLSDDVLTAVLYAAGETVSGMNGEIVVNPTPAAVINMSLGGGPFSAIAQEIYERVYREHDTLIVAAAGNARSNAPFYPASYPAVMAVSSLDVILDSDGNPENGLQTRYAFSRRFSNFGPHIDLAAPGGICWYTAEDYRQGSNALVLESRWVCDGLSPNGNYDFNAPFILSTIWEYFDVQGERIDRSTYGFLAGTSMAAPHVSGVAALLRSLDAGLSAEQIREILRQTATPIDDSDLLALAGENRDDYYGWGALNAAAAVEAVRTGRIPETIGVTYVVLESLDTGTFQVQIADSALSYRFENLPEGRYRVFAGRDTNGNGIIGETGEPFGIYPEIITIASGALEGRASFVLRPADGDSAFDVRRWLTPEPRP